MGWNFMHRPSNVKAYLAENEFTGNLTNGGTITCLDVKIVKLRTAYVAARYDYADGTSRVGAFVVLLTYTKGYYNFGYKVMEEDTHPYSYDCPQSILDLLTEPKSANAAEWRERCRSRKTNIVNGPLLVP